MYPGCAWEGAGPDLAHHRPECEFSHGLDTKRAYTSRNFFDWKYGIGVICRYGCIRHGRMRSLCRFLDKRQSAMLLDLS